jgi:predicted phosphoribosyltransferase
MYFDDRRDAARRLADALRRYEGRHPLVLAIPRGGVPIGRIVADALGGDLDVVLVHKLRAASNPELAIGSVDEQGWTFVPDYMGGLDQEYLFGEKHAQLDVLRRRRALYTPVRSPADPFGRLAIVVDDGLATGSTMVAALHAVRLRQPSWLVCAVPVASREALARVRGMADEIVCLAAPVDFGAVGRFYLDFPQVDDALVCAMLAPPASAAAAEQDCHAIDPGHPAQPAPLDRAPGTNPQAA